MRIPIKKLPNGANLPLPEYASEQSAGLDLIAAMSEPVELKPGQRKLIPCGISLALPEGYEAQIRPRSGLAFKHGITVLNAPGTIDADYRGEIQVLLINHGDESFVIEQGMRIAQMVIAPYSQVTWHETKNLEEFNPTNRGGGFGSSGVYTKTA